MKTILVVWPVKDRHKAMIEAAAGDEYKVVYKPVKAVTEEDLADIDILFGNVPAEKLQAAKQLSWMQLNSAGADAYIKPGVFVNEDILLTNATGAYSKAVAEHAFAQMLMLQKKLYLYRDAQLRNEWVDEGEVVSVADATVAIVGLGDIGLHFAKMAKSLGCYVIGVKRRMSECPEYVDELYLTEDLEQVLPRADVLVSFLPGNAETKHIYTRERFEMMKRSAYFINGGRGNAVDMQVLYDVLEERIIKAAAIDVTDPEPLPQSHPLWQQKHLVLTPHISGSYHLPETFERILSIAVANLEAYRTGNELKNIVDFKTGYKR